MQNDRDIPTGDGPAPEWEPYPCERCGKIITSDQVTGANFRICKNAVGENDVRILCYECAMLEASGQSR